MGQELVQAELTLRRRLKHDRWCYEPNQEGMKAKVNCLSLEGYRLPSEAEWEFACRAGSVTSRYYGETEELLGQYAWYTKNSQAWRMLPAGSLKPNDLGLFDMLGNAGEWCHDWFPYYRGNVLRGGTFMHPVVLVRSADRRCHPPAKDANFIGFRVARTVR